MILFSEMWSKMIGGLCEKISVYIPEQVSTPFSYASDGISHYTGASLDWSAEQFGRINIGLTTAVDSTVTTLSHSYSSGCEYLNTITAFCGEKYEIFVEMIER